MTAKNDKAGAFPVDRPIDALLRDHNLVRRLADAYLKGESMEAKHQVGPQILMALETHSLLEEGVFYPAVRDVDPPLIARFEQAHHEVDDLLDSLKNMSLDDAESEPLMRELLSKVMQHVEEEEGQLFPKLRQANIDWEPIGLQMQAYEANLVHMQAQASDRSGMRRK